MRYFLVVGLVLSLGAVAARADDWGPVEFGQLQDAFTDATQLYVGTVTSNPVLPSIILLVCTAEGEGLTYGPGELVYGPTEVMTYRFDDWEPGTAQVSIAEARNARTIDPDVVADFRDGFERASRLRIRVGTASVQEIQLVGSTAAVRRYIAACDDLRGN